MGKSREDSFTGMEVLVTGLELSWVVTASGVDDLFHRGVDDLFPSTRAGVSVTTMSSFVVLRE